MHKRPKSRYQLQYCPISLPRDFPISGAGVYNQPDKPITSLHLHDCLELGYCYEGAGIFVVEEKVFTFSAGDVSIINDRERHLAQSLPGTTSRWTFLSLDPAGLVDQGPDREVLNFAALGGPDFQNLLKPQEAPELGPLMRLLIRELQEKGPGHRAAVRGLVWTIMAQLHRLEGTAEETPARRPAADRISPALEYLMRHFAEPVPMAKLASLCRVSPTHLRRLFQTGVGRSPHEYLTHLRIQMAAALLQRTSRPVLEIALEVGFPTLSSFNRHFHRQQGVTPRAWRKGEIKG